MIFRITSLLLALGWMAFIHWESSGTVAMDLPELFPHEDKLAHLILFGLLAVFYLGAFPLRDGRYRNRDVWIVVLLASLYGLTDEWHQSFVPGRTPDIADLLADAAGALLFAWTMAWGVRKKREARS